MPSFTRLSLVVPLGLFPALFTVGSTGCYMAADDPLDTGASVEGLSGSGSGGDGGSSTGPVDGGRGIIENNGFKLYWEHYDAWEQGACTRLRLKNEGGEVRGWEMNVELSEDITNWIDSGGAFMWLVDDQLTVEQEDYSDFDAWESVEMYYCAEPAADIDSFSISWREGDSRESGGSTDDSDSSGDDDVDLPGLEGELPFRSGDGRSAVFAYESYVNGGYTCLNFDVENTSVEATAILGFDVQLGNRTEFVYYTEGAVVDTTSDVLSFIFDNRDPLEPGEANSGRVCMTAMAEPELVLNVVFE